VLLLERLLAISLVGGVAVVGLDTYVRNKQVADMNITASRINSVFNALDAVYEHHCANVLQPLVSSADLLTTGLVTAEDLSNPWQEPLIPNIDWTSNPVMLLITMNVDVSRVNFLQNNLNPALTSGSQLTWRQSATSISSSSEAMLFKSMYETGCQ
jgi:hypothetical protein